MFKFNLQTLTSLTIAIIFVFACKKPEPLFTAKIVDSKLPDDIAFYDLNPGDSVQSVNYYYQIPIGANICDMPYPDSNLVYKNIDVDGDNNPEFQISARHHKPTQISGSSCPPLHIFSSIYCFHSSDKIITQYPGLGDNNPFPFPFQYNDTIKEKGSVNNMVYIHFFPVWQPAQTYKTPTYFGFKRVINNQTYYGWLLVKTNDFVGVKVYGFAINKTPGNPIKAGQTE